MTNLDVNQVAQFIAILNNALNPSAQVTDPNSLGFVAVPEGDNKVRYLFPNYDRVGAGQRPYWVFPGQAPGQHEIPPSEALRGTLKFINLVDAHRGGKDVQKAEFWLDAGTTTYVLELGWVDENSGKINNATKSFLKSLSALSPDELRQPITVSLTRLVDKPGFVKRDGGSPYLHKVLVTDVFDANGNRIFDDSDEIDVASGSNIICNINGILIEKPIVNPREKKQKQAAPAPAPTQQQAQYYPTQPTAQPPYQQQQPVPTANYGDLFPSALPVFPDSPQRNVLVSYMDNHVNQHLGGNMEILKQLVPALFPGKHKRPHLNDLELQTLWNELQKRYPAPAHIPQPPQQPQPIVATPNQYAQQQSQPIQPQYNPDRAVGF
ncbi:MAG: hypothetical protein V7L23_15435 [Nostoc sp.]|uniref:hypothetical protein n=1 Tax=Nostoc sp. TaxID=1180 RepID=UPI002FF12E16